jgi:hypothetical protein
MRLDFTIPHIFEYVIVLVAGIKVSFNGQISDSEVQFFMFPAINSWPVISLVLYIFIQS